MVFKINKCVPNKQILRIKAGSNFIGTCLHYKQWTMGVSFIMDVKYVDAIPVRLFLD